MKMMGLSDAVLRSSWFITSGAVLLLSVVGITVLLKTGAILPYSDWLLIMLYMLLYAFSMIGYRCVLVGIISVVYVGAGVHMCIYVFTV